MATAAFKAKPVNSLPGTESTETSASGKQAHKGQGVRGNVHGAEGREGLILAPAPRQRRHERSPADYIGAGDAGEDAADGVDVGGGGVEADEGVLDEEVGVEAGVEETGVELEAVVGVEKGGSAEEEGVGEVIRGGR